MASDVPTEEQLNRREISNLKVLHSANSPIGVPSGTGMVSASDCMLLGRSTKIAKPNSRTADARYLVICALAWTLKLSDIRRPRLVRRYKNSKTFLRQEVSARRLSGCPLGSSVDAGSLRPGSPNQKGSSLHHISWKGGDNASESSASSVSAVTRLRCDAMASERRYYDTKTSIQHVHLMLRPTRSIDLFVP